MAAVGAVPLLGYLLTSTAPGSRKTAPQRAAQRPGLGERNGERSTKERSGAGLGQSSLPVPGALGATLLGALTSARGHGSGARHIFHTITGGTSWHMGLSLQGRHLGAHPVNPFLEAAGSFPGCPRCPWLGAIPQRGRVFAAGPPEKINAAGPAAQHGTGIAGAWPRCLLSAQLRGAAALNTNICVGSAKKKIQPNNKEKEIKKKRKKKTEKERRKGKEKGEERRKERKKGKEKGEEKRKERENDREKIGEKERKRKIKQASHPKVVLTEAKGEGARTGGITRLLSQPGGRGARPAGAAPGEEASAAAGARRAEPGPARCGPAPPAPPFPAHPRSSRTCCRPLPAALPAEPPGPGMRSSRAARGLPRRRLRGAP